MGEVPQCDDCPANLWQANFEAVEIYGKLATQMKYAADGSPTGLDYGAMGFIFELYDVEKERRKQLFDKVLIIEKEVLATGGSK